VLTAKLGSGHPSPHDIHLSSLKRFLAEIQEESEFEAWSGLHLGDAPGEHWPRRPAADSARCGESVAGDSSAARQQSPR
jgi:hypothetical protein